jgi:hypothetical protein
MALYKHAIKTLSRALHLLSMPYMNVYVNRAYNSIKKVVATVFNEAKGVKSTFSTLLVL